MTNLSTSSEVWKDIPNDFIGLYQASSLGQIRSLHNNKIIIIKSSPDRKGYLRVKLQKSAHKINTRVHRLVALAFHSNPLNLPQVNHKDGDKLNNKADNLEWCTNKFNQKHRFEHLTDMVAYGKRMRDPERCRKIGEASRGANNARAKRVIDISTGEEFGCIADAANKHGYTYNQLKQWLNGARKNPSTLRSKG